ncbi:Zn-ribbon domain-containing OB-fold protein [Metapseudomonas boanensis]|uniref:OB-fold domain-containing protein n=1 Tax=Metapseudomonas boanensis TaxID=2822138 RepID=A0ABS5XGD1_9GAMM|nr:OB-fold domain-containing protein [Pseudomonas boanensis]
MKGIGADGEYWAALAQGKLKMQRCDGCGHWNWPAVWRCGECGSWEQSWHEVEPRGRIYSWTRSWYDFGAPRDLPVPYVSVVVELDGAGGKRLLGTLDTSDLEPAIGQRVSARPRADEFEGEPLLSLRWSPDHSTLAVGEGR